MLKYLLTTFCAMYLMTPSAHAEIPANRMATDESSQPVTASETAPPPASDKSTQAEPTNLQNPEIASKPLQSDAIPKDKPEKRREMGMDVGLGGGGFFSEGAESAALLVTASLGYRFDESWQLGLAWDAKLQLWAAGQSMFHTVGLGLRWRFYDGLYTEARLGPAFSRIELNGFEQSDFGFGWGLRLGYQWMPHPAVGLNAAMLTNMRYTSAFYADLGAVVGVQLHF
jgi:hypothetical protein